MKPAAASRRESWITRAANTQHAAVAGILGEKINPVIGGEEVDPIRQIGIATDI
jgi:hypothetical protein